MTTWQKIQIVIGIAMLVPLFWITFFLITEIDLKDEKQRAEQEQDERSEEGEG